MIIECLWIETDGVALLFAEPEPINTTPPPPHDPEKEALLLAAVEVLFD